MRLLSVLALLVFSGMLLFGCTSSGPTGGATATPSESSPTPQGTAIATGGTPSVQEFRITAQSWEFTPSTITVKKGIPVKLTIESIDVQHGFALPDFGVSKQLNPGEKTVVEFTPGKSGEFSFFCNVFCGEGHRDMKGTLVVTD